MTEAEAIAYAMESGHWRTTPTGEVLTNRQNRYTIADWRPCKQRYGNRHRVWIKGRRVYAARLVWALTRKCAPSKDVKIVHKDGDPGNDAPHNLTVELVRQSGIRELAYDWWWQFKRWLGVS